MSRAGDFAGSRREMTQYDRDYIARRRAEGVTPAQLARMTGLCEVDVAAIPPAMPIEIEKAPVPFVLVAANDPNRPCPVARIAVMAKDMTLSEIRQAHALLAGRIAHYEGQRALEEQCGQVVDAARKIAPTFAQIAFAVAQKHSLTVADLTGGSRSPVFAHPRQEAYWTVHKFRPDLSLVRIGQLFGGRDHTTILYGIRRHEERMAREAGE